MDFLWGTMYKEFFMPKIKDALDFEWMPLQSISGSGSYNFPINAPATHKFQFIFKRDENSIWVDDIIKEEDNFLLGGAL
jgi:hypothetical protein